jgi:cytidine deaminase
MKKIDHPEIQKAWEKAVQARSNAYAPYSKFLVGVCLKVKGKEDTFLGCNVENSSFGAVNCAERSAVFSMVSNLGRQEVEYIVLVTDLEEPAYPCGICLQVLNEFSSPDMPIYLGNLKGLTDVKEIAFFLPNPFNSFE